MKSMAAPHCNLFRRALLLLLLQSAHMAAPGVAESPAYSVQLMTGAIHPKGVEPVNAQNALRAPGIRFSDPRDPWVRGILLADPNSDPLFG